ncbi:hypothetical protein [Cytobacillus firmus]|uniref:hypothetical protein n=1 Tax=Cytobacillus firmus TaxID=1399 RepID=UPI0018CDAF9D|nr:hypothetical protein [Cytobacillus firmus]MBG9655398.1 hypothetical protein [Cytobacillus firmus]MED1908542.1 hypothetical protein [Cytobacillus firmus]
MTHLSMTTQQYQFNKTRVYKKKEAPARVTPFPVEKIKHNSTDALNEVQTINFIKIEDHKFVLTRELIREIYLEDIKVYEQNKNKNQLEGHISNKKITPKVSGFAMSINVPLPVQMFAGELKENFSDGLTLKLLSTLGFGFLFSWLNINPVELASGLGLFFLLVILDLVLSRVPGNVKEGTELEHTFQVKVWSFVTNLLTIIGGLVAHSFFEVMIKDPAAFQQFTILSVHFYITAWVGMIYIYRIVKYSANSNKIQVPAVISKIFEDKKEESENSNQ